MYRLFQTYLAALLLSLVFACKDDKPTHEEPLPDPEPPKIRFNEFKNANATLQATYYSSKADSGIIGMITYFKGIAFAAFRDQSGKLTSPGKVKVEAQLLSPSSGIYTNKPVTGHGIDFGSTVEWDVQGKNAVPDIDEEIMNKVPEIGDVSISDTIDSDFELSLIIDLESPYTSLGQVDSVNYLLVGKKTEIARKTSSLDSVYFTPSELQSLGSGKAYVQAEAFRFETKTYSGYQVVFVNKGIFDKAVWIR